jgi:hypothetical protein
MYGAAYMCYDVQAQGLGSGCVLFNKIDTEVLQAGAQGYVYLSGRGLGF